MSRLSLTGDGRDKWDIRLQSYIGSAIRSVVGIRSNSSISSSSSGQCSDGKYFATSCIFGLANVEGSSWQSRHPSVSAMLQSMRCQPHKVLLRISSVVYDFRCRMSMN